MEMNNEGMLGTTFRFCGKEGRTTIPWHIRQMLDIRRGDILKYQVDNLGRVIVTKEKICDHCADVKLTTSDDLPDIPPELIGITLPELNKIYASLVKRLGLI